MKATLMSKSVIACSHLPVCLCVRLQKCHRFNLHGDDVLLSQAPAVVRGGGGDGWGLIAHAAMGGGGGGRHQNGSLAQARC